jgi:hypothetical protein
MTADLWPARSRAGRRYAGINAGKAKLSQYPMTGAPATARSRITTLTIEKQSFSDNY